MSTKTSFKRIALVAASALAIAGFSAVPANAGTAAGNVALVATSGDSFKATNTAGNDAAAAIAGVANSISFTLNTSDQSASYDGKTGGAGIISVSGAGSTISAVGSSITIGAGTAPTTATIANNITANNAFTITTPTVGTITVSYFKQTSAGIYSTTAAESITVTVNAASIVGAVSVSNSKSYITDSSTVVAYTTTGNIDGAVLTTDATILKAKTGVTAAAVIQVKLMDTQSPTGVAMAGKVLSATVAGSGLIDGTGAGDDETLDATPARVASSKTNSGGFASFKLYSDNTAGTSTVTITYTSSSGTTTTIATETATFFATDPAAIAATQNLKIAPAGSTLGSTADSAGTFATTSAVTLKATDSNGNLVSGLTAFTAVSSNPLVLSNTISVVEETSAGLMGPGYYNVQINGASGATSGASATLTISATLPSDSTKKVSAAALTFSIGGSVATGSVTAALDATSYASGTPLVLTFTAKDSKGNPVFDQTVANLLASGGVKFNYGTGIDTTDVSYDFIGGTSTLKAYAPLASGALVATGTWGSSFALQAATKFTVEAETTGDTSASLALDAANAATDAANNAYDEAQNATQAASDALAAVTALAAQVKSLIASVKKLTAAVAKLKK